MEFGNLGSDDGFPNFSYLKKKAGSGQPHGSRNPHWELKRYLDKFCIKWGFDDFVLILDIQSIY
jgi:hypothetical protein